MRRASVLCILALVAAGSTAPATAKPAPVKKSFQVSAFPPDPTYGLGVTQGTCNQVNAMSHVDTAIKTPFAGTLTVDLTGFTGDWDLALYDSAGVLVQKSSQSATDPVDRPEHVAQGMQKAGLTFKIRACNFAGGQTATVSYVMTAK